MTYEYINKIRNLIKRQRPLIHCITNPISINQCANVILSLGASPIMAEHPDEAAEITDTAQGLMLNLGNITDVRMKSMLISSKIAAKKNIPVLIDVVGIAASSIRRSFANSLIAENPVSVIKGNYSEIMALYNASYKSVGVDAESSLGKKDIIDIALLLAKKYRAVILASGETDIITDGNAIINVKNGTSQMAAVTGTGCMLGAAAACFSAVEKSVYAIAAAAVFFGICGETAETEKGNGSFMVNLLDNISVLSDKSVRENMKMEEKKLEEI